MSPESNSGLAARLINEIAALLPEFLADPADMGVGGGNVVVVAIDPSGEFHGRFFGTDRDRGKFAFGIATKKALQVMLTGYATGRFEELVFSGQLDPHPFGIMHPDFIGWTGGVPLLTADGKIIAAACSGMRGTSDAAIVERAGAKLGLTAKRD